MDRYLSRTFCAGVTVLTLFLAGQSTAAVLTFDAVVCEEPPIACGNGLRINQGVGDIAGELDVVYANRIEGGDSAEFSTNLSGIRWFGAGYGDLTGVLWARGDNGVGEIALLPAAGFQVSLASFDLGSFSADVNSQYTIYDGNYATLASSGPLVLDAFGPGGRIHYHYDFNLTSANGIIIQWGPDSANIALDNLQFEVTAVPAPASATLLVTGLALLVSRARAATFRRGTSAA